MIQFLLLFIFTGLISSLFGDKSRRVAVSLLELSGVYEAAVGIGQLLGRFARRHALFVMTGTFDNPGPFGGYVAMVAVVSLADVLKNKGNLKYAITKTNLPGIIRLWIAIVSLILCVVVLPASMSRAAWIAFVMVAVSLALKDKRVREFIARASWSLPVICIVGIMCLCGLFALKKDSAVGRFHIWHMEARAVAAKPLNGYGFGKAQGAYGAAQHDYFAQKPRTDIETRIAGCPEYAFNEYLKAAQEGGVFCLAVMLIILTFALYRLRGSALQAGLMALSVFAAASYPLSLPEFRIAIAVILGTTISSGKWKRSYFPLSVVLVAVSITAVRSYHGLKEYYDAKDSVKYLSFSSSGYYYPGLEERLSHYSEVLRDEYRFLYEYGLALNKAGRFDESNTVLANGASISCDPMFHNIMGKNYQSLGRYEEAAREFEYASFMVPSRLYPHILQMELELSLGKDSAAMATAERVLAMPVNPRNANMTDLRERAAFVRDSLVNIGNYGE